MPIRRELRYLYPIDWPQLSALIRFERARGRCERCGRPHGKIVYHLGDGRWSDEETGTWRDGRGREAAWPAYAEYKRLRRTRVVPAAVHLDHDRTTPAAQREGAVPALPPAARPAGAPAAEPHHDPPAPGARRPVPGAVPAVSSPSPGNRPGGNTLGDCVTPAA